MRGHIWKLPPQELNGNPIEIAAWEIADSTYILLSADWLQDGKIIDCVIGAQRQWYMTHQLHCHSLPILEVIDHTTEEIVDSYVHSKIGTEAILIGLASHFQIHPIEMMSLFQHWKIKNESTN